MTEDEMVGWHHQLNEHESEQALGDGEGQGRLACCSPWGCKESDTTERLNNNNNTHSEVCGTKVPPPRCLCGLVPSGWSPPGWTSAQQACVPC